MSGYTHFARYYDALTQNVRYRQRAEYFDQIIRQYRPERGLLLDLACGTGSLSLELATLGYEIIGVDGSADMLSAAMQKTIDLEPPPLFLCQAMDYLDLYGTVQACVCALDSLNHLQDEAALERVFSRLALFLEPGGIFVFDVNTAYKHRQVLGDNTFVYDLPEVYCIWQNAWHERHDRIDITLDFFVPQHSQYTRYTEQFSERIYSNETLTALLEQNRLELVACYGDDTFQAPGSETQRLIYVTRRRED